MAWIEGDVIGGAKGDRGLDEGRREKDFPNVSFEGVGADEVAGELVVESIGEDEFDFVAACEGVEIFEAEAVGGCASARAFNVDDLVHGFGDVSEGALAGGLDHEIEAAIEESLHQRNKFAGLQHGFAAGELHQTARRESFDPGEDFFGRERLAAGEGVFGVAPGAAEITTGEADENTGEAGEGAFALNGFVEFDEMHELAGL